MTIISGPDNRNAQWASDKSAFGQRMLLKMGWSEGKGLGKNQQGTNTNLRAVRREEGLGIGAKTDTFGEDGFSKTSQNFHGVLANLHKEHGTASTSKKKSKKKKKDKNSKSEMNNESGLTLSQNKVTAGHARKMRESKDLTKKSKEDMAAIFGMKVDDYQSNSIWGKLSSLSSTPSSSETEKNETSSSQVSESDSSNSKKKRRKDKKKNKKRKKEDMESSSNEADAEKKKKNKKKSKKKRKVEDS